VQFRIFRYSTGTHLLDQQKRPYLIVGGYYDYGILEPGQINIITDGMLQVKDYRWLDIRVPCQTENSGGCNNQNEDVSE